MCVDAMEAGHERDAVVALLSAGAPIRRDGLTALQRAWRDGRGMTSSRWLNFLTLMEAFHDVLGVASIRRA